MDETQFLSVPLVVMALLELIKYVTRLATKKPTLDFQPIFYELMIPFLSLLVGYLFGLIGWETPIVMNWMNLLRWGLNIVLTLIMYHIGLKPLKDYIKAYNLKASEDAVSKREII